jgi:hypothetical protein
LGCYLCDIHDLEIWKDASHKLKVGWNITRGFHNEMLWKTLQFSYDHLIINRTKHVSRYCLFFHWFQKIYILLSVLEC